MKTKSTEDRAEQQAKSQLESIREMVRALDRESYIEDRIAALSDADVETLCTEAEISFQATGRQKLMRELCEDLRCAISDGSFDPRGFDYDEEAARDAIQEDPLSVQIRDGWRSPGEKGEPEEFEILLCTGGPAVRIIGDLDEHSEPSRPRLEYQDWGTPWTEYFIENDEDREALETYCRQFYFGE